MEENFINTINTNNLPQLYAYNYYEEYKSKGLELRQNQMMPKNSEWHIWLICAGRGFGKTISGAAAIDTLARNGVFKNIAIIGATFYDSRHIMCENGLLKVNPKIKLESSKHKVSWENGATGHFFSGDYPNKLRGYEFDLIWIDELVKIKNPEKLWEQISFCLRLKGQDLSSKIIITTTPNSSKLLETIAYDSNTAISYGSSYDNAKNLSDRFFQNIENYKNTKFGEQEIYGKIINESSLWRQFHIQHLHKNSNDNVFFNNNYDNFLRNSNKNSENLTKQEILQEIYGRFKEDKHNQISELDNHIIERINKISFPDIEHMIDEYTIGIDPAFGGRSETGIILVGVTKNNQYYVLEDLSGNYSCSVWTRIVRFLSKKFYRCSISIETNHGGGIFREIFGGHMYIKENRAFENKFKRSVSSLIMYENSEVIHYKPFKILEGQMLNFRPNQNDRVDALVWALKFLKNRYNPDYWHNSHNNLFNEETSEKINEKKENHFEKPSSYEKILNLENLDINLDLNIYETLNERKKNDYKMEISNNVNSLHVMENNLSICNNEVNIKTKPSNLLKSISKHFKLKNIYKRKEIKYDYEYIKKYKNNNYNNNFDFYSIGNYDGKQTFYSLEIHRKFSKVIPKYGGINQKILHNNKIMKIIKNKLINRKFLKILKKS